MQIGVIGINHKSANLSWREQLAKAMQRRFGSTQCLHSSLSYVLLSTCNRTELYFSADDVAQTHTYLISMLRREIRQEFEPKLYSYFGYDCFYHLARVTSGMDSAIVGETEIQGQVKLAYEEGMTRRSLASELHFLFQKSLKIGKEIRSSWLTGHEMPSLKDAVFEMSAHFFPKVSERRLLLVGVSEINCKLLSTFKQRGMTQITLCNRTSAKARDLAAKEKVDWLPWEKLALWSHYDVAVFGTKCPEFVISGSPGSLSEKKLLIDLSVPRNVDPRLGRHPAITLLNVDQLQKTIDRKKRAKALALARIENEIISQSVVKQVGIFKAKQKQHALGLASSF